MTKSPACGGTPALPGFDSACPSRREFQEKAARLSDLLAIANHIVDETGDLGHHGGTLIMIAAGMAEDLVNGLDAIHEKGSDLQ